MTATGIADLASADYKFSEVRARISKRRGKVLDFAFGDHRLAPPPAALELLVSSPEAALRPASIDERERFRKAAAAMLDREYGVRVSPDGILPVPSGRAGIALLVDALLDPGDQIMVTEPGYPVFAELARLRPADVHVAPLDPHRGFSPDFDAIASADRADVALVAFNYPNNPSGAVADGKLLAETTAKFGNAALVFNDAAYAPLVYDQGVRSLLSEAGDAKHGAPVVELHSFSKLFGIGPLGLSFLAGEDEMLARLRRRSEFTWSPLSALHIEVARRCAVDWEYPQTLRKTMGARVARLRETLSNAGLRTYPTPAGMYVLCRTPLSIAGKRTPTAEKAAETLLELFELAVVPWDSPSPGFLRFSALYNDRDIEEFDKLGRSLKVKYE
jgi:LL-diaminopimelate aminotransferase